MGTLLADLQLEVRGLLNKPGFTTVAVLSLGLGIGANTTIFSVAHSVLLKPLPFMESIPIASTGTVKILSCYDII